MNKKLFGTLLLGSLLMGGTFVSCKDYDDDIENLQGQITDVKTLVDQLQSKLDGMTYVQSVTKSSDGKTIKFTMSNGQTVEFTDTDTVSDPGSVVTVEDGVLCIDGKPTEIKVASAINMPKVENGQIYIFDEETGEYAATGIFVNQNTVVESATKYTITMTQSNGTTATFDVPKASGLITEIKVAPSYTSGVQEVANFPVAKYTVASTMNNWPGVKPGLKKGNIVFGFGKLNIRVNPVAVDLKNVKFYLVDTKNDNLPSVELSAVPEDGTNPLKWGQINTRANEGNGLWTLCSDNVVIEKSKDNTLDKKLDQKVAYAVTAGSARSSYCVDAYTITAPTLDYVYFKKNTVVTAEKSTIGNAEGKTVLDLNKAYKIVADDEMALYDVYMSVDALDKETFGIEIDNTARTLKYTKQPDIVTTDDVYFWVNVKTADNEGTVKDSKIKVMMSSKIGSSAKFDAVEYKLAQLFDWDGNNDAFVVSLAPMKTALGSEYTRWANNVDLSKIGVTYYTNEACTEGAVVATGTNAPNAVALNDENKAASKSDVSKLKFAVAKTQTGLKIGKQYYAKVTFKNSSNSELNSIVIPVKFTAPTVADQFTAKAGYVVDGVINAYFYDVTKSSVTLSRYFDAADANATLTLKNDDKLVKIGNADKNSSDLAAFVNGTNDVTDDLKLANVKVNTWDATEAGYGKVLTVNAVNSKYASTSWSYDAEADTKASFQIKIMSPIYQGTIKPADGVSVKLVANNVSGSNITSEMIVATDYTGTNRIEIMPDKKATAPATLAWSNPQIMAMAVSKDANNTYISALAINPYVAATTNTPAVLGSINVKADPVANDVDTHIYVSIIDAWGYVNTVKLPVTITKQ